MVVASGAASCGVRWRPISTQRRCRCRSASAEPSQRNVNGKSSKGPSNGGYVVKKFTFTDRKSSVSEPKETARPRPAPKGKVAQKPEKQEAPPAPPVPSSPVPPSPVPSSSVSQPPVPSQESAPQEIVSIAEVMSSVAASGLYSPAAVRRRKYGTTAEDHEVELKSMRTKFNQRLSEANSFVRHLQREQRILEKALEREHSGLEQLEVDLRAAADEVDDLGRVAVLERRHKESSRLAGIATIFRLIADKLAGQLQSSQNLIRRPVEITWFGVGTHVRVMGDFDGWTKGEALEPKLMGGGTDLSASVEREFIGRIYLRPGKYKLKFLVDEKWRLSGDLPREGEPGMDNNILDVAPE